MKFSDGILKGYKTNGGRQCVDALLQQRTGKMCVMGAYLKACNGDPNNWEDSEWNKARDAFEAAWGVNPIDLNNNYDERGPENEPFPWEHIYGMARAAGL